MTNIEDRLRNAFDHEASTITEASLGPGQPPSTSDHHGPESRWRAAAHSRWLWPSVAAAAVVALTVGISAVRDQAHDPVPPTGPTTTVPGPTTTQHVDSGLPIPEKGREYDVGAILGYDDLGPGGSLQIYLHRINIFGMSDAEVAQHGVQIVAHTDSIYAGQSAQIYAAPVAKDATFIINECATISSLNSRQVSSDQFLRYQNTSGVVFRFNAEGRIVDAETDGGC